jgi:hypothetical protein
MSQNITDALVSTPSKRKLQGYAFDPSLSLRIDTAPINHMVYTVDWELLDPGPVGEYIEVIDFDPTVQKFYEPVNLNHPYLLAENGLQPAESNPQFHQQMVYAVAMTTIKNFESALGRKILWAPRMVEDRIIFQEYVQRLRLYPHAMREANAYYSPEKKAVLFGYFESVPVANTIDMPGAFVFTCLSHDIIAHEVTHAILDGLYPRFSEASNPDVLAFHEAFSDIVALFQHFTFPDVLKHQIASTRGDLAAQNELGKLAQQFGSATGGYGSLRDALGAVDPDTKQWKAREPNGDEYMTVMEPHDRGSILVSAVFEAFITIYKSRAKDLLRIATGGTGVLPLGELHPDLVNRLATEASKAARHVLSMCIRALDFCPPVDITFGDYLRGIITADFSIQPDDEWNYRLAFIDAFRRRGIYPQDLKTFGVDTLKWQSASFQKQQSENIFRTITEFLREYAHEMIFETNRYNIYSKSREFVAPVNSSRGLHNRIAYDLSDVLEFEQLTGLVFNEQWQSLGIRTSEAYQKKISKGGPSFQITNLRLVSRVGPSGNKINQIMFCIIQRSGVIVEDDKITGHYSPSITNEPGRPGNEFDFYGGCTMIFDLVTLTLQYVISKPLYNMADLKNGIRKIDSVRASKQHRYQNEEGPLYMSEYSHYFGMGLRESIHEPFAFLHQH